MTGAKKGAAIGATAGGVRELIYDLITRDKKQMDKKMIGITTKHKLLTGSWTDDVETMETAIGRFKADQPMTNSCKVVFFEMAGDSDLHVNVTHQYSTRAVRGWAGPGTVADGFVHNRTFGDAQPTQMIRQIRDMVFAARV